MNLLAHLHLGEALSPMESAGNLTADFCRDEGPPAFQRGVLFHRAIDAFTDAHAAVAEARAMFSGEHRRFGGVLSDFAFDCCLTRTWSEWGVGGPVSEFIDARLSTILRSSDTLPAVARAVLGRMEEHRWLHRYGDPQGIRASIARLSLRRPVASRMFDAERVIKKRYDDFVRIFRSFYPQVLTYAKGIPPSP